MTATRTKADGPARGRVSRGAVIILAATALAVIALVGYALARKAAGLAASSGDQHAAPGSTVARTIRLKAGDDLQRALDAALPGDTLVLPAGSTFVGPLTLNKKRGDAFVTVQSSALAQLPPEGQRVSPRDAPHMPRVVSPGRGEPALQTAPGAHHYRFVGVEFATKDEGALVYDLVKLGGDGKEQDAPDEVPHHLIFDRCLVHAHASQSLKRGVALNSAHTEILNSHVAGFKVRGQEAQALCGWNGPGPFKIVNNYLEAAGENIMFGGAQPSLAGLVPSDIEVRRNHLSKPASWRGQWTAKNILELKNARRVVIDGNLLEHSWLDAQQGYAVLFTPRPNDSGGAAVVEDVEFTNNVVRRVAAAFHVAGQDDLYAAAPRETRLRRVRIANNLVVEVDYERWGGDGCFLKIVGATEAVTVEHNTILQTGNITKMGGDPHRGMVLRNNIARHNEYGVFGDSVGYGRPAISAYMPGAIFARNVIVREVGAPWNTEQVYPPGNFFPASMREVGFVNLAAGDFRLAPNSPFKLRATDGKDIGCDFAALEAAGSLAMARQSVVPPTR